MTPPNSSDKGPDRILELHFESSDTLMDVAGEQGKYLRQIEKALKIEISQVGNVLNIIGTARTTQLAQETIDILRERVGNGLDIEDGDVDAAIRIVMAEGDVESKERAKALLSDRHEEKIVTQRKHITPRSNTQAEYLDAIDEFDLVFGVGPAGTGKTYLAVAKGVQALTSGKVKRLIVTRPAVEAGEQLGFLPGTLEDKIDPYLRPVYDALYDMLPKEQVIRMMAQGHIEIAPLAFMRGRTLNDAFVILDEAQNTTSMQMKMFLTRMGENSVMVACGDATQTDLGDRETSGLAEAIELLGDDEKIAVVQFTAEDVVRHPIVAKVIKAYATKYGG